MIIAVGSTNPVKCNAVRVVLSPLYPEAHFVSLDVPSGVAVQPWGDVEARTGAVNRARAALEHSSADLAAGLEGGVVETEFGLMTNAWCALVDRQGRLGIGGNCCTLLPEAVAQDVRRGMALGAAMARLVNRPNTKHQNGAIGILTKNLETRQTAYEMILRLALAPFQNPDWYPFQTDSYNGGIPHE